MKTKRYFQSIVLLLVSSFLISPALAIPDITSLNGQVAQGEQIIISGSGFGGFSSSDILLWENFDQGTNGDIISGEPLLGSWDLGSGYPNPPFYSSVSAHRGFSSYYSSSSGGFHSQFSAALPHTQSFFYGSFWYRYHYPTGSLGQTKILQLWGTLPNTNDFDPGIMSGGFSGTDFESYFVTDNPINGGRTPGGQYGWPSVPAMDSWHHFELILKQSGDNIPNGSIVLKNDGITIYQQDTVATRYGAGQYWDQLLFFYGFTNFGNGQFVENYVDEPYLASTWARVEIGDHPVYEESTHREIQIPSSWNDNTLQFTASLGSFTGSEQLYLFVIDKNGAVSDGYPIPSGQPSPSTCPSHDANDNNIIEANEMGTALSDWLSGSLSMHDLIQLMGYFKEGTCG
jgi:hypothetical protein